MSSPAPPDELTLLTRKIVDVSMRLGILLALVVFSFWIMSPFLSALAWGGILGMIQDNGSFERGWLLGYINSQFCLAVIDVEKCWRFSNAAKEHRIEPGHL